MGRDVVIPDSGSPFLEGVNETHMVGSAMTVETLFSGMRILQWLLDGPDLVVMKLRQGE